MVGERDLAPAVGLLRELTRYSSYAELIERRRRMEEPPPGG